MNATLPRTTDNTASKLLNTVYARLTLLELSVNAMADDELDPSCQYFKIIHAEIAQAIAELSKAQKALNA
ncbi:hypothetical protein [Synechococcus sp. PCC 6312]|uniref:hypothetical protein n=1 Tax=Synechococcus sp. (strain ATCC 27167 / PCC 6312) TaxID=195253 RepID=UPI00029F2CEB|nr:hypothetical protein [Synechococcus sp. PCC 6312]AFY60084.1 hypothetical protein Syn6312_0876 [Synechococcus sp. PCC 6312]